MQIILGLDLEGCPFPTSRAGSLNQLTAGPKTFLELLEMRLGLAPVPWDESTRLLAFRKALDTAGKKEPRFYGKSFSLDPLGSAKVLLRWRDELRLSGWTAELAGSDAPKRINDLAAVESLFNDKNDEAGRLRRVAGVLADGRETGIDQVDIIETRAHYPKLWQNVLDALAVMEGAFPLPSSPVADPDTALYQLQQKLLDEDALRFVADGTVRIVSGAVPGKVADAAANHLRSLAASDEKNGGKTGCLVGGASELGPVHRALWALDAPASGYATRSATGSLLQLAPLVLRLHWGPFDPQAWLEFFLHPVSPLSGRLAGNMAYALNSTPSRESDSWKNAIRKTIDSLEDRKAKDAVKKQAKEWLGLLECDGNTETLSGTAKQLSVWIGKRGTVIEDREERAQWQLASWKFQQLAGSLASVDALNREDFERVISDWLDSAVVSVAEAAELGCPRRLGSPGHLLDEVDDVTWWQPDEKTSPKSPWYPVELEWLSQQGVEFPDRDLERERIQEASLRPILLAKRSVTLFYKPKKEKAHTSAPPILNRILAAGRGGARVSPDSIIKTEIRDMIPLQSPKRKWEIGRPELLGPRESESYSSLHHLVYSPWQWVLQYRARLRPGRLLDYRIVDDARRKGSLLHGFVESLLEPEPEPLDLEDWNRPSEVSATEEIAGASGLLETLVKRLFDGSASIDWKVVTNDVVEDWVESHWNSILAQQAAHYLIPENAASRSELLYLAKTGLLELINQLRAAGIVSVRCEERLEGVPFCGGSLTGFIDLQLQNERGESGVIDLKLGGKSTRREELAKGRHLQLATYGHLIRESHSIVPHCGYFIFMGGGTLLSRSGDFFKNADVVRSSGSSDDWTVCWSEFEDIWKTRRAELDRGEIEVTLGRLGPTLEYPHWVIKKPEEYSRFLNLAGWEVNQ